MMRSIFGGRLGIVGVDRIGRDRKSKQRRLQAGVEGLESRNLMSVVAGSVTPVGNLVLVTPNANLSSNTAIVSYQMVGGVKKLDVNLNGADNYYGPGQFSNVLFLGAGTSSNETFINETGISTNAYGGSGTDTFTGGSGIDQFYGGSGTNTFNAGSGFTYMVGGSGTNVFNESATGWGTIVEIGSSNTVNPPA